MSDAKVMLYDLDTHDARGDFSTMGWKVRVLMPDGLAVEGGLILELPNGRIDVLDAVEAVVQSPEFALDKVKP